MHFSSEEPDFRPKDLFRVEFRKVRGRPGLFKQLAETVEHGILAEVVVSRLLACQGLTEGVRKLLGWILALHAWGALVHELAK